MQSPFTGKEMSIVKEERTMSFRKDEFKVLFHSYKCEDTGEQFEDDAFAQLNYNQLVNQYRVKYSIPFPEQIISILQVHHKISFFNKPLISYSNKSLTVGQVHNG